MRGEETWVKELEVRWSGKLLGAEAMLWVRLIRPKRSESPARLEEVFQPEMRKKG